MGRQTELSKLEEWVGFRPQQLPQKSIVAIWGFSGVGKSQLASEFVKKQRESYPNHDIFWLRGETKEAFGQSILSLLKSSTNSVGTSSEMLDNLPDHRAMFINSFFTELKSPSRARWLLIIDGISSDLAIQQYVHGFLNGLPHGSVILITRSAQVAARYHQRIEVKGLSETDAVSLLVQETDGLFKNHDQGMTSLCYHYLDTGDESVLTMRLDVLELAILLKCHPLSLNLAGSAIVLYPFTIAEYIQRWKMRRFDEDSQIGNTMLCSFEISFEELDKANPLATKLLTLFAFLDHRDMWYDLCLTSLDDDDSPDWLQQIASQGRFHDYYLPMRNLSFVEAKRCDKKEAYMYEIHPAIHEFARWRVKDCEEEYIKCAISLVAAKVPRSTDADFLETVKRLEPHAEQCKIYMEQDRAGPGLDLVELEKFGNLFRHLGRYEEASHLYDGILNILKNDDEEPDESTVHMIAGIENNLGLVYHAQRKYDLAIQVFDESYHRQRQFSTFDQDAGMATMYNKGRSFLMLGKLDEAVQLLNMASVHFNRPPSNSGNDSHNIDGNERGQIYYRILNDIGEIHLRDNGVEQAEQYFRAAFDGQRKCMHEFHPATFAVRLNIGRVCVERMRFVTANKIFTYIIATYTEWWGRGHFETMRAVAELADSYTRFGEMLRLMSDGGERELAAAAELWAELLSFHQEAYGVSSDTAVLARSKLQHLQSLNSTAPEDRYSIYYST